MEKKTIAVIFGGQSSEHEISCMSAQNVIKNIDKDRYDLLLLGITKDGRWIKTDSARDIESGAWKDGTVRAVISPDAGQHGVLLISDGKVTCRRVDAAFPVLHGLYGEDGTIQGLLELARIPYVGCGVLSSAVSMDKLYTKIIVDTLGIRQADYVGVRREELKDTDAVVSRIESKLRYPMFVKPSEAGSSMGVSKAKDRCGLADGLNLAAEHDSKILIEEAIVGREAECAVLQDDKEVMVSGVGEILAAAEFYDYDAKYNNSGSETVIDPDLPEDTVEKIREEAAAIFKAVDGCGFARVDFFVRNDNGEPVFNEINTIPGFTAISMYPMLWENRGIGKRELVEKLIQSAFLKEGK